MRPRFEVAQVLQHLSSEVNQLGLSGWQLKTLRAIEHCRTAALGAHVDACTACGKQLLSYNSCRNRHCPKCQGHKREEWIQDRSRELLPVPYFHVVFTLPSELNALAMHSPKLAYDSLFAAAWQTLAAFGRQQGLQMGMVAILHTWGQNLSLHPHLHCIVPGGGVCARGRWRAVGAGGKFLFHVKALGKMFRAKYVAALRSAGVVDRALFSALFKQPWVVYAKKPFASPWHVVEYLGRYTHKIAISNHRLQAVDRDKVRFGYKDYRQNARKKSMELSHREFIRRFALHILPRGFVRIRHYGFLSSTAKARKLAQVREQLQLPKAAMATAETQLNKCPFCKTGSLITLTVVAPRPPPKSVLGGANTTRACAKI